MKSKINIPNLISLLRSVVTPIIILFVLLKLYIVALIFIILAIVMDYLDGMIARKLDTESTKGTKLDLISNKIFTIGTLIAFSLKYKSALVLLILEVIISLSNLYYFKKTKRINILSISKFKQVSLYIALITTCIAYMSDKFITISSGFRVMTINLQILVLLSYFVDFYKVIVRKKEVIQEEKIMNDETIEINDLNQIREKYNVFEDNDF